MGNKIWSGREKWAGGMWFFTSDNSDDYDKEFEGKKYKNVPSIWITNTDHGRRHQPIPLMTMEDNIKFSKHKEIRNNDYKEYDNYDALEVPHVDAIPSDYSGLMGVPISYLDKHCPEQFGIIGCSDNGLVDSKYKKPHFKRHNEPYLDGKKVYKRIFIKHKEQDNENNA